MTELNLTNWDNYVIYQIYPASYKEDSCREQIGIGSLRGIIEKLDYLEWLGVDAVWLSPFYVSPLRDGGYDVADATSVSPQFGSIEDAIELIDAAHDKNIRIMVDFIPNHTSDQHPWFIKSSSSKDNDKSDWYIWRDAVLDDRGNRLPPNNWASVFSLPQLEARRRGELPLLDEDDLTPPAPAWTWCDSRQQYYLHSFANFQPDLNWHNPEVREAKKAEMRFWIDLGVDGLRIDAVNYIGKNPDMPDEEKHHAYQEGVDNPYDQLVRYNSAGYPDTFHAYIDEIISVLKETDYKDRNLRIIFEAYMEADGLKHLNEHSPRLASSFNFAALNTQSADATVYKLQTDTYYSSLPYGAVGNQVSGNHDKPRLATSLGEPGSRSASLYNLMLPGQTFIYNGEELGLTDHPSIPQDRLKDPNGLRDAARTPMLWDSSLANYGFSAADSDRLYLPINPNDAHKSIADQTADKTSHLWLIKAAIKLKKISKPRQYRPISLVTDENTDTPSVIGFEAVGQKQNIILRNFSDSKRTIRVCLRFKTASLLLSSRSVCEQLSVVDLNSVQLAAFETVVLGDLS